MKKTSYKRKEDKIETISHNKQGTPMKLIDYKNALDCTVEFQDKYGYVFEHANYQNFLKGQIKNPYDKTVFGIGMLGAGKYPAWKDGAITKEYHCWSGIIERCYKYKERHLSYYQISTICDEWLIFQNFAKWHEENFYDIPNNERLQVDKDILNPSNKHYSPETCILVPQRINLLFTNMTRKDGLPNGVRRTANGKRFQAMYNTKNLGTYDTLGEAYSKYAKAKEEAIKVMADEYKEWIPQKLFDALYNYKVKIEDDKNYEGDY